MNNIKLKDSLPVSVTFWAYDIFGYLLPGLFILAAIWLTNSSFRNILHAFPTFDPLLGYILLAALAYFTGHVVAAVSSFALERSFLKWAIGYPSEWLLSMPKKAKYPLSWLFKHYQSPYPTEFRDHFIQRFEEATGFKPKDSQDIFMLCWSFISISHPIAYKRATHFLELYGFSRNSSMAFFLSSLFPLLPGWNCFLPVLPWVIVSFLSGVVMFMNYTKLLRRCDDEVIRALIVAARLKP